jgi:hypothetical protein
MHQVKQEQQKNMMDQLGHQSEGLNTARSLLGLWYTNSCFSFWWLYLQLLQEQQKNIMELLGQINPTGLNTARYALAGCGTQTAGLAFGGEDPGTTGATEEYDGTSWTTFNSLNTARVI